jgi:hypothetical protein
MLDGQMFFGESTSRRLGEHFLSQSLFPGEYIHGESIHKPTAERACLVEPANPKDGMAVLSNSFVRPASIRDYETNSRCQCLIPFQLQHNVNTGDEEGDTVQGQERQPNILE